MENEYRSTKMGDIQKCPNCGAVVETLTGKCKECGYEFRNAEVVDSVKKFHELLIRDGFVGYERERALSTFPIPSSKEDLFSFMTMLYGLKNNKTDDLNSVYCAKYQECVKKVQLLYPADDLFAPLLKEAVETDGLQKKITKYSLILIGIGIVLFVLYDGDLGLTCVVFGIIGLTKFFKNLVIKRING